MLYKQIKDELKESMLAKDELRTVVLRSLVAAFTNEIIALKKKPDAGLSDEEALVLIKRGVKQRKDSIDQFRKGGREDLAKNEEAEMAILEKYLPKMMSKSEIKKIAEKKKKELGVTDKTKTGQLMAAIMKEVKGKADGADVKEVVNSLFE